MFDIITFGSATKDIMAKPKQAEKYCKNLDSNHQVCEFEFGDKVDIEDMKFNTGGGGTNTAVGFALQGFKTAYCGMVGDDLSGQEIINELKKFKVDTIFVKKTDKKATNHSIVILNGTEDRVILVYRGASELVAKSDISWNKLKTKWIYLAPLSGMLCDRFEEIVNFAYEHKIKIAINPGMTQLSLPQEKLEHLLKKVDVLFLNQEEASFLTKATVKSTDEIFKKLTEIFQGVTVMTRGGEGVMVSGKDCIYSAIPPIDRKVIDTTGAGDSFASGFLSEYIRTNGDIEKSTQLGMANSVANLAQIGAKTGLLKKDQEFERTEVIKEETLPNPAQ